MEVEEDQETFRHYREGILTDKEAASIGRMLHDLVCKWTTIFLHIDEKSGVISLSASRSSPADRCNRLGTSLAEVLAVDKAEWVRKCYLCLKTKSLNHFGPHNYRGHLNRDYACKECERKRKNEANARKRIEKSMTRAKKNAKKRK